MATTSQLRNSYPELVTSRSKPTCDYRSTVSVRFPAGGPSYPDGYVHLRVHPTTRQIWRALAAVMLAYGYEFRETAGGTLSCRKITGGTDTSLHAHGVAGDWNPSKNKYTKSVGLIQWGKQTDMSPAMILAIEAIKLTNGLHPLEWGGRWWNIKDAMHFEVDILQTSLAPVNLATLPAGAWAKYLAFEKSAIHTKGDPMLGFTIGPLGADSVGGPPGDPIGDQAQALQLALLERGEQLPQWGADRFAGDETRTALRSFQTKIPIASTHPEFVDGIIGPHTHAALYATAGEASAVDPTARASAKAAAAAAAKANATLDKIRSE